MLTAYIISVLVCFYMIYAANKVAAEHDKIPYYFAVIPFVNLIVLFTAFLVKYDQQDKFFNLLMGNKPDSPKEE